MNYPIAHWSYSSLSLFLRNRFMFKKRYILKIYNDKTGPAAVVGKAGHAALEYYYKTGQKNIEKSIEIGLQKIENTKDD